jgi:hypothetical protein
MRGSALSWIAAGVIFRVADDSTETDSAQIQLGAGSGKRA